MKNDLNSPRLDGASFQAIADLAYRESGLQLVAEKSSLVQSRLRHRIIELGMDSFQSYSSYVCSPQGAAERPHMISALTTNVSHFFREQHHFDILAQDILPRNIERVRQGGRFRIWSAGCSNGQEPYSIAMTVLEAYPEMLSFDFKILATDIDEEVVNFATKGLYPERLIRGVPQHLTRKYFEEDNSGSEKVYGVNDTLRSKIFFNKLNLLSSWPMKMPINVIFCRNVVIYFDAKTQNQLWPKFSGILAADGKLFLGHSERIADPENSGFITDGPTSYRPDNAIVKPSLGGIPNVA